ncbi:hypothetical protein RSAG8_07766, partial [Rhizoctonia solani AG-8 WAC10335]
MHSLSNRHPSRPINRPLLRNPSHNDRRPIKPLLLSITTVLLN